MSTETDSAPFRYGARVSVEIANLEVPLIGKVQTFGNPDGQISFVIRRSLFSRR